VVKTKEAVIELARGPYYVSPETGPEIAEKVWFRHFRPAELWLAKEFIRKALIPGTYYFDVYLLTEDAEDWIRRQPEELWRMAIPYMHRIDMICITEEEIWIVEFKIRLKYSGVGQLLVYRDWFKRQYKPTKPVKLVCVVAYDRPELHETLRKEDIRLIKLR